jgi:hypothetical protein
VNALPPRFPPRQVPVLTEVIEVPDLLAADGEVAAVVTSEQETAASLPEVFEAPAVVLEAPQPLAQPAPLGSTVPPALSALLEQPPIATEGTANWGLQEQIGQVGPAATGDVPAPANDWAQNMPSLADVPPPSDAPLPVQAAEFIAPSAAQPEHDAAVLQPADEQLTQRVLNEVQRHIDLMLEYRLRQVLGPILARAADGIVKDARQDLAATLRDVVARAVSQELARQRGK